MKSNKSIYTTLGASSHSYSQRHEEDYYATDPIAAIFLIQLENFQKNIWECACGDGSLSRVFEEAGFNVRSSDIADRGFGEIETDFLGEYNKQWDGDIVTNPPYKIAREFIEKALSIVKEGSKVAMFLRLQFLEGSSRKDFFKINPPKKVYVSRKRIACAINGDFDGLKNSGGSAVAYAWFVWEKGYSGNPEIEWFN